MILTSYQSVSVSFPGTISAETGVSVTIDGVLPPLSSRDLDACFDIMNLKITVLVY